MHLAASDGAPGFEALVDGIADTFGGGKERLQTLVMNDHNADWDSLYPFSLVRFRVVFGISHDADLRT